MTCFHPLDAFKTDDGKIVFSDRGGHRPLTLPCGQCIGCRLERSRQWAVRIMHESQMHSESCFVTLTYDDEHLPYGNTLHYRHFQLFMKKLRKKLGVPLRFYMCGEYGEQLSRPHYHACLFGCSFLYDRQLFSTGESGFGIYTSDLLSSVWTFGFSSVADLSFESAAYVARYCMKKITGPMAVAHYERLVPDTGEIISADAEFCRMSLKPGIGREWLRKYTSDVYPRDYVVVNGMKCKPPRYYDKIFEASHCFKFDELSLKRFIRAQANVDDCTPERLAVREDVTRARLSFKRRSL